MKTFKYIFFLLSVTTISTHHIIAVDAIITVFIKEETEQEQKPTNYNEKLVSISLKQPSFIRAIAKDRSWLNQPGVDGLQASYLGYITTSDKNGQISFPRMHQADTIYLLVTPEVAPEFMIEPSMIAHWITKNNQPAAFYEIHRKKEKELKTYYFDVKKIDIPKKIPYNTMTIYAHPDDIKVPVGISLNTYSTNFILPELQGKKVKTVKNSLYTLTIKQYFEQINKESKNDMPTITTMIVNQ